MTVSTCCCSNDGVYLLRRAVGTQTQNKTNSAKFLCWRQDYILLGLKSYKRGLWGEFILSFENARLLCTQWLIYICTHVFTYIYNYACVYTYNINAYIYFNVRKRGMKKDGYKKLLWHIFILYYILLGQCHDIVQISICPYFCHVKAC